MSAGRTDTIVPSPETLSAEREIEVEPGLARLRAAVRRANRRGFFFVNIGANDGVSNDYITEVFVDPYLRLGRLGAAVGNRLRRLRRRVSRTRCRSSRPV
jgi:hypothetical protein